MRAVVPGVSKALLNEAMQLQEKAVALKKK